MKHFARGRTTITVGAAVLATLLAAPTVSAAPVPADTAPSHCVSATPQAEIAALTDPAGIDTFDDARTRIAELRDLLTRSDDYRGTFVLAFDEILELTGPTLDSGIYDDPEWASALAVEVVRLYLANLHEYVTGGSPAPHWADALALTEQCDRSPGRVLLGAIVAHLVVDFPEALVTIGSTPEHTRDFYTFGEALVDAAPVIAEEFEAVYGVDLGPFFTGWFVGDLVGDTETTTFMFQSARTAAWVNNFGLQNPATHDITRLEMNVAVDAAAVVLDGLEQAGIV
ncbi:DUF5995 family protein [Rhodococcus rhodochrous]|uniref:DUF5995 family protein n=1 Tax=Rhodococcus rhodochrous TaxID=1829 RepID=A0AAW4XLI9_RHORH|nr:MULTISPECIES: DUF5995 family protein [Rhodococcus]MCD2113853.1 DUF5995 family protein [Rhodococcus rhodochrous]WAL48038.1 DUF5995 family protein [Rhodococcus pyridinivorans]